MSFFKKKNIAKFLFALTLFISFIGFVTHIQAGEMKHSNAHQSMMSNMAEKNKKLDKLINESLKHEKGYTFEEILTIPVNQFPKANFLEVKQIKDNIRSTLSSLSPEAKKKLNEKKYPLSMVYIDKTVSKGWVATGLPCLDNNGWGPENFTGSDCFLATLIGHQCDVEYIDHITGGTSPNRYCIESAFRNCSPLIGHDIWWHTH